MATLFYTIRSIKTFLKTNILPILLVLSFAIFGCKPDSVDIQVYSEDIRAAVDGETAFANVKIEFSPSSGEADNFLDRIESVVREYIGDGGEISLTKGEWNDTLTIKYSIPIILHNDNAYSHLKLNKSPLYLEVKPQENGFAQIILQINSTLDDIDELLSDIDWSLGVEMPAEKTIIELLSDSKTPFATDAYSVFIDSKPYIRATSKLSRRDSISFTFYAKEGTIYNSGEIKPMFWMELQN